MLTDRQTDGRTDGRTDRQTDGRTDGHHQSISRNCFAIRPKMFYFEKNLSQVGKIPVKKKEKKRSKKISVTRYIIIHFV